MIWKYLRGQPKNVSHVNKIWKKQEQEVSHNINIFFCLNYFQIDLLLLIH